MFDSDFESEMKIKYPTIFDSTKAYGTEISTSKGWNSIVDGACALCARYTEQGHQVWVEQVKEKFGQLRFYVAFEPGEDRNVIGKFYEELLPFEQAADETCEFCGSKDKVKNHGKSWLKTLCEECHLKRERKNPL